MHTRPPELPLSNPPSSALAGAAAAVVTLTGILAGLAARMPVDAASARAASTAARRLGSIAAPRVRSTADVATIAVGLIGAVQGLARACAPADAAPALYAAATATRGCAPVSASPVLTRAYGLARAVCVGMEAACLGEAFLCEARTPFGDRQAASAARDRITAALDDAADRIAAALGQPAAFVLTTTAGQTCAYLADLTGSLKPIVRGEAGRSYPSTQLAWSLYADPARAIDLVARNRCGTPLFMPASFEALAPT